MHTKDQTYLAKLGFADQDKKNPLHDNACLFLAHERVGKLVQYVYRQWAKEAVGRTDVYRFGGCPEYMKAELSTPEFMAVLKKFDQPGHEGPFVDVITSSETLDSGYDVGRPELSKALVKGEGQYKTIVGFFDLYVQCRRMIQITHKYSLEVGLRPLRKLGMGEPKPIWQPLPYKEFDDKWGHYDAPRWVIAKPATPVVVEVKVGKVSVAEVVQQIGTYREFCEAEYVLCSLYRLRGDEIAALDSESIQHIYVDPASVEAFTAKSAINEEPSF